MRPKYGGNGQGPLETLEEPTFVSSPLGIRARIGMICRGCELDISGTLLTVNLRIMDMLEFNVTLRMDWLIAYRVVIDYECRRVTTYTQDGTRVVFQGNKHDIFPQTVYESRCQGQLAGWLASVTLEDEERPDLDLPRVVCYYVDVFPDELPGLLPQRVVDFGIELHPGTSLIYDSACHTPIPGPTRLADPNRFRGARTYTGTLYLIFFRAEIVPVGMAHIL